MTEKKKTLTDHVNEHFRFENFGEKWEFLQLCCLFKTQVAEYKKVVGREDFDLQEVCQHYDMRNEYSRFVQLYRANKKPYIP